MQAWLMLTVGIHVVASRTSVLSMILITSFMTTTTFCMYKLMVSDYAIARAIWGFGTMCIVRQSFMSRILLKSKQNLYIAYSIWFVLLLSAILIVVESMLHLAFDGMGN